MAWNPIRGCSRVSTGCENCFAERIAARFSGPGLPYEGLARRTEHGPRWTGEVRLIDSALLGPVRWREPRRVFVNSMSDLFHEKLSDRDIDRVFAIMQASPQHTFQVLTKRPNRMRKYVSDAEGRVREACEDLAGSMGWCHAHDDREWPLSNVWLGVSIENQETANTRVPLLLRTPAVIKFLSCEPLLEPIDLDPPSCQHCDRLYDDLVAQGLGGLADDDATPWCYECDSELCYGGWLDPLNGGIGWVIAGAESGPEARPMQEEWVRSIRRQCAESCVPLFYKQALDERGRKISLPLLDGTQWKQFPEVRRG